jgi:hypothetical protein
VIAKYYLHQRRSTAFIRDLEGAEFDSVDEAREEVIAAARELLSEMALTGVLDLAARFEIVGEDGSLGCGPIHGSGESQDGSRRNMISQSVPARPPCETPTWPG